MEFLTDPWSWWVEPFTGNAFMLRALTAGLLTVVATSVVGTWLVLRGMTYLGDALAHGVLPGIAMAYVFGGSTTLGALLAALVMVGGIHVVRQHSPLPDDVSIGLLFVAMLALTVVIVSRSASASTFVSPTTSTTAVFQANSILGLSNARCCMILDARSSSRRWMTVTLLANLVRKVASWMAESPPPTTAISWSRKKNPSHVAHADTP